MTRPTKDQIAPSAIQRQYDALPAMNRKIAGACVAYLAWIGIAGAVTWISNIQLIFAAAMSLFSLIFLVDLYRITQKHRS